jgi:hypothetical protein
MNRSAAARLRLLVVILAWLAQALMPQAHALSLGKLQAGHGIWCGDPSAALAVLAALPPELRAALDDPAAEPEADRLAGCALLCAAGSAPPLAGPASATEILRAAGLEPAAAAQEAPPVRPQAPTPPAQAPPPRS